MPEPETDYIDLVAELGEVHFLEKDAKKEKDRLRLKFFSETANLFSDADLAQKTWVAPAGIDGVGAAIMAERYNPGWTVVPPNPDFKFTDPLHILLVEDPNYRPYSVVVACDEKVVDEKGKEHPGYVVTKSVVDGAVQLDDSRLREDNPELYQEITEPDVPDWIWSLLGGDFYEVFEEGAPRVPIGPDRMTGKQLQAAKPYLFEGPKQLRLLVRYAKWEEIV